MVGLKFFLVAVCIALCADASRAQTSAAYDACSTIAKTQTALTNCAIEELTRAETGLDVEYDKLLHKVAGESEASAKIRGAERAWFVYRDAYLEAMFPAKAKQAEYGSIYPMEADLVLADLTRQQTIALSNLLKAHNGCTFNSEAGCVHRPSTKKRGRP